MDFPDKNSLFALVATAVVCLCLTSCVTTTETGNADANAAKRVGPLNANKDLPQLASKVDRSIKTEQVHRQANALHQAVYSSAVQQVNLNRAN